MKLLRLILVLVLSLAIPFAASGGERAGDVRKPCPMQHSASPEMPAEHDCCQSNMTEDSADKAQQQSSSCKPGQECKVGAAYPSVAAPAAAHPLAVSQAVATFYDSSLPVRAPSGVWRPPRWL